MYIVMEFADFKFALALPRHDPRQMSAGSLHVDGLEKSRKIDELATKDAQCFLEGFVIA
jgi:hypothetical protein